MQGLFSPLLRGTRCRKSATIDKNEAPAERFVFTETLLEIVGNCGLAGLAGDGDCHHLNVLGKDAISDQRIGPNDLPLDGEFARCNCFAQRAGALAYRLPVALFGHFVAVAQGHDNVLVDGIGGGAGRRLGEIARLILDNDNRSVNSSSDYDGRVVFASPDTRT
jgi:hypothetical protein